MKKVLRNIVCGLAAVNLIALAASCSDGLDDDDPFVKNGIVSTNGGNTTNGSGGTGGNGDNGNSGNVDDSTAATIFETATVLDWDMSNTVKIDAAKFANATDTSKILFTYVDDGNTDYHKFKMMGGDGAANELYAGTAVGFTIDTTSASADELHGCSFSTAPSATPVTLSYAPTAAEWVKIKANGFAIIGHGAKVTKVALTGVPATTNTENGNSGTGATGTGENQQTTGGETTEPTTPVTYSTARKAYTVSLTKAVDASVLGYVLQIDNDGTKDADGLKIDISNLKLSVKVGDADAVEKTFEEFNLVPNQWASPAYGKTDARKNLGLTGNLAQGTEITVQVLSGTVSNSAKAPSIIFALQEDADPYGMLGTESGDSQDIWLPAFAEATEVNAEENGGAAANQEATNVIYDGKNVTLSIPQNFYEGANHGISLRKTVAEMGINLPTPQNGDSYTIYMKGTADHYEALGNMCVGFETDYDWQNCAMDGSFDLSESKLTAGTSKDVTFNGTADGDWYFWFYDGDTDANAEPVTLTLSEFKITKK